HHDLVSTRRLQLQRIDAESFVEVVQHCASYHRDPPAFGWGPGYKPGRKRRSSVKRTRALQRCTVPVAPFGRRLVGALHERQQVAIRVLAAPHGVVGHDELAESAVEARRPGAHRGVAKSLRLRVRIGVEDGLREAGVAWPEAGAADL